LIVILILSNTTPKLKSPADHYFIMLRFMGQNRPQFRALNSEDPAQVKDLVERLEKHQSPDADDAEYVKIELAKYGF